MKLTLDEQIESLELQRNQIIAKIQPLQDELIRLSTELKDRVEEKDRLKVAEITSVDDAQKLDWDWLLEAFPESHAKYKARLEAIQKLGLMTSGYWTDTKQATVKIALTQTGKDSGENAKQLASVKRLLPFIKMNDEGVKKIDIFEHTLSEYHSYWLEVLKDGRIKVARCCDSFNPQRIFNTLEEAFEYVSKYLWYEGEEEED